MGRRRRPSAEGNVAQPSAARPASTTPPPDASAVAEPTPGALAAGLDETCGSPSGWRAATLQDWAGRSTPIRSWIAIEPVTASGAADPAVPFAPVATGIVTAIGYCAPLGDAERPPAAAVASLWAVRDGQAIPLSLLPLEPSSPDALGGLWRRPPEVTDEPAGSGPVTDRGPRRRLAAGPLRRSSSPAPGGDYHRWLGIEIADLSLLRASPEPDRAASPSPSSDPSRRAVRGVGRALTPPAQRRGGSSQMS